MTIRIRAWQSRTLLLIAAIVVILCCGCNPSRTIGVPILSGRIVAIGIDPDEQRTAPFELTAYVVTFSSFEDQSAAPPIVKSAEMDFGDGSGWITAETTAEVGTFAATHTYAVAGQYTLRARATYHDDEVIDSNPRTLVALPAAE